MMQLQGNRQYEITWKTRVLKKLKKSKAIPREVCEEIEKVRDALSEDPFHPGIFASRCKAMQGKKWKNCFRIRLSLEYRLVYEVREEDTWVIVHRLGHRQEIFKK